MSRSLPAVIDIRPRFCIKPDVDCYIGGTKELTYSEINPFSEIYDLFRGAALGIFLGHLPYRSRLLPAILIEVASEQSVKDCVEILHSALSHTQSSNLPPFFVRLTS